MNIADIETCRSYTTRERLIQALEKFGFGSYRYVIVCNSQGRFTAIFPYSEIAKEGGYMGVFACKGFLTLG